MVGTQGSLHTSGHNMWFRLLPEDQFADAQADALPRGDYRQGWSL